MPAFTRILVSKLGSLPLLETPTRAILTSRIYLKSGLRSSVTCRPHREAVLNGPRRGLTLSGEGPVIRPKRMHGASREGPVYRVRIVADVAQRRRSLEVPNRYRA